MKASKRFQTGLILAAGAAAISLAGCDQVKEVTPTAEPRVTLAEVKQNYVQLAHAMYLDSLITAQALQASVNAFLAAPSEQTLEAAKASYAEARVPYQQSEIMRFDSAKGHVSQGLDADGGPASVDDWEGQVNAWPFDEALIDYVNDEYEGEYAESANVINSTEISFNGQTVGTEEISAELLISLNEFGGSEANVGTGIHAVEFMLWGQDIHGTEPGPGERPVSDFYTQSEQGECTSGAFVHEDHSICQRRAQYLQVAMDLYVADLEQMTEQWTPEASQKEGTLAHDYLNRGDNDAMARIIESMGDMAVGELASERMRVAVLFGSTEDEHDCFSDMSHIAIYNNAIGVANAYHGQYQSLQGNSVSGASMSDLVKAANPELDTQIQDALTGIKAQMQAIVDMADSGIAFDQIVGGTMEQKKVVLDAANALVALGPKFEAAAQAVGIGIGEFDTGTCSGSTQSDCEEE